MPLSNADKNVKRLIRSDGKLGLLIFHLPEQKCLIISRLPCSLTARIRVTLCKPVSSELTWMWKTRVWHWLYKQASIFLNNVNIFSMSYLGNSPFRFRLWLEITITEIIRLVRAHGTLRRENYIIVKCRCVNKTKKKLIRNFLIIASRPCAHTLFFVRFLTFFVINILHNNTHTLILRRIIVRSRQAVSSWPTAKSPS